MQVLEALNESLHDFSGHFLNSRHTLEECHQVEAVDELLYDIHVLRILKEVKDSSNMSGLTSLQDSQFVHLVLQVL